MSLPGVVLRAAKRHVANYEEESELMADQPDMSESLDCEALLDLGIDAFRWLQRATQVVRNLALREDSEQINRAEASLRRWRKAWLRPCETAESSVAVQIARGLPVANLDRFRACCDTMRRIVDDDAKVDELAARVPSAEALASMAIPPPREWLDEPSWNAE
jgi:hypothetical protein